MFNNILCVFTPSIHVTKIYHWLLRWVCHQSRVTIFHGFPETAPKTASSVKFWGL